MITRRLFLCGTAAAAALATVGGARGQSPVLVKVFKSPACGCCGEWIKHMQANGFRIEIFDLVDVTPIKQQYGVPYGLGSCHTAVVAGYAIEGHVPAADVQKLLRLRPKLRGLAVPGMVPGSPGMVDGPPQPYATLAFDDRGSWMFARH